MKRRMECYEPRGLPARIHNVPLSGTGSRAPRAAHKPATKAVQKSASTVDKVLAPSELDSDV
jgi:hypothetical protein